MNSDRFLDDRIENLPEFFDSVEDDDQSSASDARSSLFDEDAFSSQINFNTLERELHRLTYHGPGPGAAVVYDDMKLGELFCDSKNIRRSRRAPKPRLAANNHQDDNSNGNGVAIYDANGLLGGQIDLCDCLHEECSGCHFPCRKCQSKKCGKECRCNRSVEGTGDATISEVMFNEKHVTKEEGMESSEKKRLEKEVEELEAKMKELEQCQKRFKTTRELLDKIATSAAEGGSKSGKDDSNFTNLLTENGLDGAWRLFEWHGEHAQTVDNKLNNVEIECRRTREKIDVARMNLHRVNMAQTSLSREVTILLESLNGGLAHLTVSYLMYNCSWSPQYDLRVFSNDNLIKVSYFGQIRQSSGEDWIDTQLFLSTAAPSIGGQVPDLKTKRVSFYRPPSPPRPVPMAARAKKSLSIMRGPPFEGFGGGAVQCFDEQAVAAPEISYMETEVRESVISTSFEIPRKATIPSDNVNHKVNVALINLKPEFSYETVPCKSAQAFLKAKVKNESSFPILAGPSCVFLDNNFVARSQMTAVSPQEEFWCSLGMDPSIRVDYRPVNKFHQDSGLLTKSTVITHKQPIEIKNTRQQTVTIKLLEQLPLSSDEKVKVHMIEPQLSENATGKPSNGGELVHLTDKNILEWTLKLKPQQSRMLTISYSIEHPRGKEIAFAED